MLNPPSLVGPARDNTARGDIGIHDHVCGIYETRQEQYVAAHQFLTVGLARDEQCLYIVEHLTPPAFRSILEMLGMDVQSAIDKGALQILSGEEVRTLLGGFTIDAMLGFLAEAARTARTKGFTAFRWGADMTWLRSDQIEIADMFRFESELTRFLLKHDLTGFCQYGKEDFKSELLLAAIETHPLLVYNEVVCDNFYFVPPEEYLNPGFADVKLKRMIFNIASRERLMERFLSHSAD